MPPQQELIQPTENTDPIQHNPKEGFHLIEGNLDGSWGDKDIDDLKKELGRLRQGLRDKNIELSQVLKDSLETSLNLSVKWGEDSEEGTFGEIEDTINSYIGNENVNQADPSKRLGMIATVNENRSYQKEVSDELYRNAINPGKDK